MAENSQNLKKILIVDDNPDFIALIEVFLRLRKVETRSASRAIEGIKLAEKEQPDLIMMDINMPDHSGPWAAEQLKQNPATRHIPIILLTANVVAAGSDNPTPYCDTYLSKDIPFPSLWEELVALSSRKSS